MSLDKTPTSDQIKRVPKALLHDHLDGGLRPETIIEIAQQIGYKKLPTDDPKKLADWFEESCNSHSLVRYLETFSHTIAVMQSKEAIIRVSRECAIDLARDGVVYAEVRGAPELFTEQGLSLDQVVEATLEGYKQGMAEAAREGNKIRVESLLCGMRQNDRSQEAAAAVVKYRNKGVVGFDIAGDEAGYPVTAHQKAFEYAHQKGIPCTAHAGEACGPSSVWDVLNHFHPSRIGHGVRSTEDSQLLTHLREKNIHLEVCPSSNLRTNVYSSYAAHVIDKLYKEGISVSVNTDARTVTPVTLSGEYASIAETFGWTLADFLACNLQAVDHCFAPAAIKEQLRKQLLNSYS